MDTTFARPKHLETDLASTCNGAYVSRDGKSIYNDPRLYRAQLPGANGITHARSLARLYALLIGDVHEDDQLRKCLLSKVTLAEATKNITPPGEPDRNWYDLPSTFSKGAFQTYGPCFDILGDQVFGHSGKTVRVSLRGNRLYCRVWWQLCIRFSSISIIICLCLQLSRSVRSNY